MFFILRSKQPSVPVIIIFNPTHFIDTLAKAIQFGITNLFTEYVIFKLTNHHAVLQLTIGSLIEVHTLKIKDILATHTFVV